MLSGRPHAVGERCVPTEIYGERIETEKEPIPQTQVDTVGDLAARSEEDRAKILSLTEKHSAAATSVEERDRTISGLKAQVDAMSEEAVANRAKVTQLEIDRATPREKLP